jgi:hypothetical protein
MGLEQRRGRYESFRMIVGNKRDDTWFLTVEWTKKKDPNDE